MELRKEFEAWWDEFTSAHEDWRFADSDALRWQAWQAAWNRRASPASASEAMKLVPFEPTDAMIESGCRALGALYGQYGASEAYRAMLASAPIPPVSEDRKDAERLDYLQNHGATVGLVQTNTSSRLSFIVGGLHHSKRIDLREAIDQAMQEDKP